MKYVCRLALSLVCAGILWLPAVAQTKSASSSSKSNASSSQSSPSQTSQTQNKTSTTTKLNITDRRFLDEAAEANKAEIELGQLAAQKASSDDVKKFGQRMVDDHTKANGQVEQLATEKGIKLPEKLSTKDEATKDRLEKLSGKQFDQAYMRNMVKDHTMDVNVFRREAKTAKDSDVKSFAQNTVTTLEDHLKSAKQLAPKGRTSTHTSTHTS